MYKLISLTPREGGEGGEGSMGVEVMSSIDMLPAWSGLSSSAWLMMMVVTDCSTTVSASPSVGSGRLGSGWTLFCRMTIPEEEESSPGGRDIVWIELAPCEERM